MTPCATCRRPLTGPDAVRFCERPDCWWDFSPVVRMREFAALPSYEYQLSRIEKPKVKRTAKKRK